MSKKGKVVNLPAKREPHEMATVSISAAPLEEQASLSPDAVKGLPAEFRDAEQIAGFPPQPTWTKAGQAVWGSFLQMRTEVGPNASRLYEVAADTGEKEPLLVSIWGTTVLDRQMDMAFAKGMKAGDRLAIVYLGPAANAKPGQSPPHLFAVRVKIAPAAKVKSA